MRFFQDQFVIKHVIYCSSLCEILHKLNKNIAIEFLGSIREGERGFGS